jgi:hypothetical protein
MFIQCFAAVLIASVLIVAGAEDRGWKPLFDGKTLEGWMQKGGAAKYRVENGELVGTSQPNTPNSFLCTARDFTNFILELEFKVAPGLNSGVQIRSQDTASEVEWKGQTYRAPDGRVHGIQVEIDPSNRAWSGGLYEEGRRRWLKDCRSTASAGGPMISPSASATSASGNCRRTVVGLLLTCSGSGTRGNGGTSSVSP